MFKLYTQKQLDEEIEKRMWERDRDRWIGERMDRIEKRLWVLEHSNEKECTGSTCCVPVHPEEGY